MPAYSSLGGVVRAFRSYPGRSVPDFSHMCLFLPSPVGIPNPTFLHFKGFIPHPVRPRKNAFAGLGTGHLPGIF
jgi:hypothetical protein